MEKLDATNYWEFKGKQSRRNHSDLGVMMFLFIVAADI